MNPILDYLGFFAFLLFSLCFLVFDLGFERVDVNKRLHFSGKIQIFLQYFQFGSEMIDLANILLKSLYEAPVFKLICDFLDSFNVLSDS